MSEVNVTIVGGGIVGCAIAAVCGRLGLTSVLVEREPGLGRGTTSRNSEVSHGGMYYPAGSLKARCCVQGRRLLKEFCLGAGVGYQECGKLIVAVKDEEIRGLESLLELGLANGVEGLEILDSRQVSRLEPEVSAVAGLWSPRTAVVDAEGAAKAFGKAAAETGVQVMTSSVVESLERINGHWKVSVLPAGTGRREGWVHTSDFVVNTAGLHADEVAAMAGVDVEARGLKLVKVKGNYFRINPRHQGRISHLVYPMPPADSSSLGVHLCLDLAGQLRLGPDTEPVADGVLSYQVDPDRAHSFYQGAVRFLPWLELEDSSPDMCGYRPKFSAQGFRDFVVVREDGPLDGLINLIGIDSPGLTSAPALAEDVGCLLTDRI